MLDSEYVHSRLQAALHARLVWHFDEILRRECEVCSYTGVCDAFPLMSCLATWIFLFAAFVLPHYDLEGGLCAQLRYTVEPFALACSDPYPDAQTNYKLM